MDIQRLGIVRNLSRFVYPVVYPIEQGNTSQRSMRMSLILLLFFVPIDWLQSIQVANQESVVQLLVRIHA